MWMQKNKKIHLEMILRLVLLLIGLSIAHLGVTLFLLVDLGADPFNVLIQGIHLLGTGVGIGLSHGTVHMCICFLIILVLLLTDKSYVKIGTVVCMFCGGPIIDFFTWLLRGFDIEQLPLAGKLVILVLGCGILAFGMTIVICSEAGTGPNDLVSVVISEKSKIRFGIVRIVTDVLFVVIGFLLGGTFGIGTVVCAFLVGPVADFCMPVSKGVVKKVLAAV